MTVQAWLKFTDDVIFEHSKCATTAEFDAADSAIWTAIKALKVAALYPAGNERIFFSMLAQLYDLLDKLKAQRKELETTS